MLDPMNFVCQEVNTIVRQSTSLQKLAVSMDDTYIIAKNGQKIYVQRELLIKWHDRSEVWIKQADMKNSNLVEVAEYI